MKAQRTYRISLFLVIALGWSLFYFSVRPLDSFDLHPLLKLLTGLVPTFGLVIMGLFMRHQLPKNTMTFLGEYPLLNTLIIIVPTACLTIIGLENAYGIEAHLFGFMMAIFVTIYALGEEIGWRGYLQQEFNEDQQKWIGFAFVGFMWFLWHWTFVGIENTSNAIMQQAIMLVTLIGASAGIGDLAKKTKSILVAAVAHSLGNIVIMFSVIASNLTMTSKVVIVFTCILIWSLIMRIIDKKEAEKAPIFTEGASSQLT